MKCQTFFSLKTKCRLLQLRVSVYNSDCTFLLIPIHTKIMLYKGFINATNRFKFSFQCSFTIFMKGDR